MPKPILHQLWLLALVLTLGLLLFFPGPCQAGAPVWGAKASAMGTAFVAIADDPSALAASPAGLAGQKGTTFVIAADGKKLFLPAETVLQPPKLRATGLNQQKRAAAIG